MCCNSLQQRPPARSTTASGSTEMMQKAPASTYTSPLRRQGINCSKSSRSAADTANEAIVWVLRQPFVCAAQVRVLAQVTYPEGTAVGSVPSKVLSQTGEDVPSAEAGQAPTSSKMSSSTSLAMMCWEWERKEADTPTIFMSSLGTLAETKQRKYTNNTGGNVWLTILMYL